MRQANPTTAISNPPQANPPGRYTLATPTAQTGPQQYRPVPKSAPETPETHRENAEMLQMSPNETVFGKSPARR